MDIVQKKAFFDELEKLSMDVRRSQINQAVNSALQHVMRSGYGGALGGAVGGAMVHPQEDQTRFRNAMSGAFAGGATGLVHGLTLPYFPRSPVSRTLVPTALSGAGVGLLAPKLQQGQKNVRNALSAIAREGTAHKRKLREHVQEKTKESAVTRIPRPDRVTTALQHIPGLTGTGVLETPEIIDVSSLGQKARKASGQLGAKVRGAWRQAGAASGERVGKALRATVGAVGPMGIMGGVGAGVGALAAGDEDGAKPAGALRGAGLAIPLGGWGANIGRQFGRKGLVAGGLLGAGLGGVTGGLAARAGAKEVRDLSHSKEKLVKRLEDRKLRHQQELAALGVTE